MLCLISSKRMTNRHFASTHSSHLLRYGSALQSGRDLGNPLTVYYSVRAVSVDGVRSLPSATLTVQITDAAPIPAGVSPIAPASGATVQLSVLRGLVGYAEPAQIPGYSLRIQYKSHLTPATMALLLTPSRSDYMITRDLLAPGNYFWRVRALHGDVGGPWSAGRAITVTAPVAPPDVNLFAILAEPVNAYGRQHRARARAMLDNPGTGGWRSCGRCRPTFHRSTCRRPRSHIPAGKTDATISTHRHGPGAEQRWRLGWNTWLEICLPGPANGRGQNSPGILPILYGRSLSNESVVGGTSVNATVDITKLLAPAGGTTVRLVSSDPNIVMPPATVFISCRRNRCRLYT